MLSTGLLGLVSSLLGHLLQVTSSRLPYREQEGHSKNSQIVLRDLFFMFFLDRFSNPPKSTFGPPWCQLGAQMTSKSEPKEGPGSHQKSISSKNLPNSILTTIYYT